MVNIQENLNVPTWEEVVRALPEPLKFVEHIDDDLRYNALVTLLCAASSCCPNLFFIHNGRKTSLNMFVILTGPSGSGKQFFSNLINDSTMRIVMYLRDKEQAARDVAGDNKQPVFADFWIEDATTASLIRSFKHSKTLLMHLPEASQVFGGKLSEHKADLHQLLCKAFHNTPLSKSLVGDNKFRATIADPRLTIFGTMVPGQTSNFLKKTGLDSGLVSRFAFLIHSRQAVDALSSEDNVYGKSDKIKNGTDKLSKLLLEIFTRTSSRHIIDNDLFDDEVVKVPPNEKNKENEDEWWFEIKKIPPYITDNYVNKVVDGDDLVLSGYSSIRRRCFINALRGAYTCSVIRSYFKTSGHDLVCKVEATKDDQTIFRWLWAHMSSSTEATLQEYGVIPPKKVKYDLLKNLPTCFKKGEACEVAFEKFGFKARWVSNYLNSEVWKKTITKVRRGVYEKVKK